MSYNKSKQQILKEMKYIYYKEITPRLDWMGFLITEDNKPTYHHIYKKEYLKQEHKDYNANIENGAYLGKRSHELLHEVERIDHDLYVRWNKLFIIINNLRDYPSEDIWNIIFELQDLSVNLVIEHKKSKSQIKSLKKLDI